MKLSRVVSKKWDKFNTEEYYFFNGIGNEFEIKRG